MDFFKDGDYSTANLEAAMAFMRDQKNAEALKEQDELLKKIKTDAEDAYKAQQNEKLKAGGYKEEKSQLLSLIEGGDKDAINNYFGQLQLEGKLQGIYDTFEGLEASYGLFQSNVEAGSEGMIAALKNETSIWDTYTAKVKNALEAEIDTVEGIDIANKALSLIREGGVANFAAHADEFSESGLEFLSSLDGFDELVTDTGDAAENMEKFTQAVEELNLKNLEDTGKVMKDLNSMRGSAVSGRGFADSMGKASKAATELSHGWQSLILLQNNAKLSTSELEEAYKELSSATNMTQEQLQGPGGLELAQQELSVMSMQARGSVEALATD